MFVPLGGVAYDHDGTRPRRCAPRAGSVPGGVLPVEKSAGSATEIAVPAQATTPSATVSAPIRPRRLRLFILPEAARGSDRHLLTPPIRPPQRPARAAATTGAPA